MAVIDLRRVLSPLLLLAALLASSPAQAHAHLKKADPAVGSAVSPGPASVNPELRAISPWTTASRNKSAAGDSQRAPST